MDESKGNSLIDGYLQRLEVDKKIREKGVYYVTELCRKCLLSTYYNIKEEVPPTEKMLRIFQMGHILEDFYIQNVLRNTPGIQVIATQLPARVKVNDYEIHGRIDALCIEDGKLVVHEIKTAKTASWKNTPNEEYVTQLQFYLNALALDSGRIDVIDKTILLLGEDPRNIGLLPDISYPIIRDALPYHDILAAAEILHRAVTTNTQPEPNPNWQCMGRVSYCDHIEKCRAEHPPIISPIDNIIPKIDTNPNP